MDPLITGVSQYRTYLFPHIFLLVYTPVRLKAIILLVWRLTALSRRVRCRSLFYCRGGLFCERDYYVAHGGWPYYRWLTGPLGLQFSRPFFRHTPLHPRALSLHFIIRFCFLLLCQTSTIKRKFAVWRMWRITDPPSSNTLQGGFEVHIVMKSRIPVNFCRSFGGILATDQLHAQILVL